MLNYTNVATTNPDYSFILSNMYTTSSAEEEQASTVTAVFLPSFRK